MYLILLSACWGMQLQLQPFPYKEPFDWNSRNKLGISIPNLWTALVKANIYTIPATWAYYSMTQIKAGDNNMVQKTLNWIFMLSYLLKCIYCYKNSIEYTSTIFLTCPIFRSQNFLSIYWKMRMIQALHFFFLIEIGLIILICMQRRNI